MNVWVGVEDGINQLTIKPQLDFKKSEKPDFVTLKILTIGVNSRRLLAGFI